MIRFHLPGTIASLMLPLALIRPATAGQAALPDRVIVGYWHNFSNGSVLIPLAGIPDAFDVINVAFAEPTTFPGATMKFVPAPELYRDSQGFIDDVGLIKGRGKKVLISLGGANSQVQLNTASDIQNFVTSMKSIITTYGFDGVDIDLEGQSLTLQDGDNDFRSPSTARTLNFIAAIRALLAQFPDGLLLSAAPETAFVQGGAAAYTGVFGCYLPVIHALRQELSFVQVQHYNTGSMFGRDGTVYEPATADFHVAMADMLLAGFNVNTADGTIFFPPLPAEKILIGLPASPDAAASGFTPDSVLHAALDYLYTGKSFGGTYHLADPRGYPKFHGLMTWSINWDLSNNQVWSKSQRSFLDNIVLSVGTLEGNGRGAPGERPTLEQNYPNPFNPTTFIRYSLSRTTRVSLTISDALGQEVARLVDRVQNTGEYEVRFDGSNVASGVYFYTLRAGGLTTTKKLLLLR